MSSGLELDAWQRAEFARLCSSIRRLRHGFYHDGNYVRERKPLTQSEKDLNAADIEGYLTEAENARAVFADEVERQDRELNDHGALWSAPAQGYGQPFYKTGPLSLEMQTDLFMVDYVRGFMRGLEGAYTGQTSRRDRINGICRYIKSLDEARADKAEPKVGGLETIVGKEQIDDVTMNSRCGGTLRPEMDALGGNGDQELDPEWAKAYSQWNNQGCWGVAGGFGVEPYGAGHVDPVWSKTYQDTEPDSSSRSDRAVDPHAATYPKSNRSVDRTVVHPQHSSNNSLHAIERYPTAPLVSSVCMENAWRDSAAGSRTRTDQNRPADGVARIEPLAYTHDTSVPILNQIYPTYDKLTVQETTPTPSVASRYGQTDAQRMSARQWPVRVEKFAARENWPNYNHEAIANGQTHREPLPPQPTQPLINGTRKTAGRAQYDERTPGLIQLVSKGIAKVQLNQRSSELAATVAAMDKVTGSGQTAEARWMLDHARSTYGVRSVRHGGGSGGGRREAIDALDKMMHIHKLDPAGRVDFVAKPLEQSRANV